jgi:hypothetical protein
MASPTASLATLRPDLATFEEFDLEMDRRGFIAQRVAPVIDVASQAGTFGKIPVEQLLQTRTTNRAPGGGYARGTYTFTTASYACEEHGAEEPIDDREAKMYANYFSAEQIATMRAYDAVLRNAEIRMSAAIFNATTWASLRTEVTIPWDTIATAIPITDVDTAVKAVWTQSGMWPNALIVTKHVFKNLRRCAQVIDAIESAGAGRPAWQGAINEQVLASVFDLDYVIVAGSTKNTAREGQSVTFDKVWDDEYAMVCRVATTSDPKEPCIARTFHWADDGSSIGGTVEMYREESKRSDIVRVRHDVDEIVMYAEMGHLLYNITT